jgi:hypothetical protein
MVNLHPVGRLHQQLVQIHWPAAAIWQTNARGRVEIPLVPFHCVPSELCAQIPVFVVYQSDFPLR